MAFSPNTIVTDPNIVSCSFTIPSSSVSIGTTYSTNNVIYYVTATIVSSTTLVALGPSTPPATGTLTLVMGTGPATIAYTAVVATSIIPSQANVSNSPITGNQYALAVGLHPDSPIPIGTNIIGKIGIDQTTPGVTNAVAATPVDGQKNTYSALGSDFTVATSPTDIFTITGSATKTIRILRIEIWATATTAGMHDFKLNKRSSVNSGGTLTTITATPHDSNNSAATATVVYYTANPTSLGTAVGAGIRAAKMAIPATGTATVNPTVVWSFGDRPSQGIVLRGTSEVLAINADSATIAGSSFYISIEWTEE